jgi:D-alanyl-D-alanine carboxypeptidase
MSRNAGIIIGIIALIGLFFAFYIVPAHFKNETATSTPAKAEINPFDQISINAKAAYVVDLTNDHVIFSRNADLPQPLASLTKLMTILVASNILSPKDIVNISSSSLAIEGDNKLKLNERWYFKDLADFTLFVSSNDGANAIAEAAARKMAGGGEESTTTLESIFVNQMNITASNLGFTTLHFENESGLDLDPITPGAVGSAKDLSKLFEYILRNRPELLEITKYDNFTFVSLSGITHNVSNTDKVINKVSYIIASKTGYTKLAGGNLAVVYNVGLNHPIIIVVLGSTDSDRFNDVVTLASSTSAYILGQ